MWICTGDGRAAGCLGNMRNCLVNGRRGLLDQLSVGQPDVFIALRQNLDGEVRAVALAQTAADAVRGLDDRVMREDEAVFGANLDADVAALAPLIDPPDVDEVDDRWGAVRASLGGVWSGRG